jgi:hypothetical protein
MERFLNERQARAKRVDAANKSVNDALLLRRRVSSRAAAFTSAYIILVWPFSGLCPGYLRPRHSQLGPTNWFSRLYCLLICRVLSETRTDAPTPCTYYLENAGRQSSEPRRELRRISITCARGEPTPLSVSLIAPS